MKTFLDHAIDNRQSMVLFGDRLYSIGMPTTNATENTLVQRVGDSQVFFPLSCGTPISDIERATRLESRDEIETVKTDYIEDHLQRDGKSVLDFTHRYNLLKFIVDEIFPKMIAAPLEDRVDAIVSGKTEVPTGSEIIAEAMGDQIERQVKTVEVRTHAVARLEEQLDRDFRDNFGLASEELPNDTHAIRELSVREASIFSKVSRNVPMLILGGKVYQLDKEGDDKDLHVCVDGQTRTYNPKLFSASRIKSNYSSMFSHTIRIAALEMIRDAVHNMEKVVMKDVEYMPLMDCDEFRFRDIGFYRNGEIYYVFKRIPKFARQTTYDANLFLPKDCDDDGFAGDFGIGLVFRQGKIQYLGYHENEGGVTYRGSIKEDAPFYSEVNIVDPVMRTRYGKLRTICHVGGYPNFPMSAEGFIEFLNYATTNFLDSFRQDFIDRHYNLDQQAELLDSGFLLTKDSAQAQGYMLTNIHEVKKGARR
jgi:hypothetical protein